MAADIRYGATQEEWDAFLALAKEDVRPSVCDPNVKKLAASKITDPSKVPSRMGEGKNEGFYYGINGWVERTFTDSDIESWRSFPQHGICLVGNNYKAFDIDVDVKSEADAIHAHIEAFLGHSPVRFRDDSPRRVILFRVTPNEDGSNPQIKKAIIKTPNGAVELLANKQHFMVAGRHKKGSFYKWEGGLPTKADVKEISLDDLTQLCQELSETFGTEDNKIINLNGKSLEISQRNIAQLSKEDHELAFVLESEYFKQILNDGKVAVKCPFEHLHSSTNGEDDGNVTATVYMPKGLGGIEVSGFKCMHTSHGEITKEQFLDAIHYVDEDFENAIATMNTNGELEVYQEPPSFVGVNSKTHEIPANTYNVCKALEHDIWFGISVRYDTFKNVVEINYHDNPSRGWTPLSDNDYTEISNRLLVPHRFKQPSREVLRGAVMNIATKRGHDSAMEWINKLEWDGKERIKDFASTVLKMKNTKYSQAVVNYLWTALAGRALSPGIKADMIPVLIGKQGVRKSTFVNSLVPKDSGWAGEINIANADDNNARLVQGKLVIEIPELKGLTSKAEEFIKAWVTRTDDQWIPKFMEQSVTMKRRFVMIGSANYERFLSDSTGNRRWLPIVVCTEGQYIDIDYLRANLEQLWAEAKYLFKMHGIMWKEAETLGEEATKRHMAEDAWKGIITKWVFAQEEDSEFDTAIDERDGIEIDHILTIVLQKRPSQITRGDSARVERILSDIGYVRNNDTNKWHSLL